MLPMHETFFKGWYNTVDKHWKALIKIYVKKQHILTQFWLEWGFS